MMSFKKNVFVLMSSVALVLIGCWLVGIPRAVLIDGLTLVIATVIMSLAIEDLWRKILTARNLLTWQYFVGFVIICASVMAWLWASESVTTREMAIRLGLTFFSGCMGFGWMAVPYRDSTQSKEAREEGMAKKYEAKAQKYWSAVRAKIAKGTRAEGLRTLAGILRYRTGGDDLDGDLVLAQPLALIGDKLYSYEDLVKAENNPEIEAKRNDVYAYLQHLVRNLPE